jgi:uncharacterized protein (TIGR02284 family)
MAVNRAELIDCLNELIQICRDGESGFQIAADRVKDPELKELFEKRSIQRAQFAHELASEVRHFGGTPLKSGSAPAALHRGWVNVKSIVREVRDEDIIAECARGEDAAVETYQRVLKQNLPPNVLPVAKHQFTEIKRSHDHIWELGQKAA